MSQMLRESDAYAAECISPSFPYSFFTTLASEAEQLIVIISVYESVHAGKCVYPH